MTGEGDHRRQVGLWLCDWSGCFAGWSSRRRGGIDQVDVVVGCLLLWMDGRHKSPAVANFRKRKKREERVLYSCCC